MVRPQRTRPAGLAAGSLHHRRHTGGLARGVRTGGRSSALRTESCARTSRRDMAPRRSRRAKSATPCHRRGSNRTACWACADLVQVRRKRVRRAIPLMRSRLARRESYARLTPSSSHGLRLFAALCAGAPTGVSVIAVISPRSGARARPGLRTGLRRRTFARGQVRSPGSDLTACSADSMPSTESPTSAEHFGHQYWNHVARLPVTRCVGGHCWGSAPCGTNVATEPRAATSINEPI